MHRAVNSIGSLIFVGVIRKEEDFFSLSFEFVIYCFFEGVHILFSLAMRNYADLQQPKRPRAGFPDKG